jgi:DNA-directed RNA polymerase I subunit RPA43
MSSAIQEPASPEKKDKRSKREKGDHKSKKRHRETEAQADEGRDNKRSKREALTHGDASGHVPSDPVDDIADGVDDAPKKKEKRQRRKKRPSEVAAEDEHTDQAGDTTAVVEDDTAEQDAQAGLNGNNAKADKPSKPSKKNKKRHGKEQDEDPEPETETAAHVSEGEEAVDEEEKKQRKKEKKEKKRKAKEAQTHDGDAGTAEDSVAFEPSQEIDPAEDAMDVDGPTSKPSSQGFGKMPDQPYPFFTQKVSQYLPLFPSGMIEPIEGYAEQHLKPLLNHYVPTFKGVLLGYHDVEVGEAPGSGSVTEKSESTDEALLESIDEYAVCFGWLTAKLDLFKPSRGAWMEGAVNMQTEGHLGVVCWGMFNASIEAGRLPKGWRWISLLGQGSTKGRGMDKTSEEAKLPTPEPHDEAEEDMTQLHTTGYWVDENGQRVRGTLRFQIKNFEVGVSGDYGYLSIEGTMLDEDAEKKKIADELEKLRRWKLKNGASRKEMKRLPDFSMTKFGMDAEEEDESKRAEIWKGSRPGSETAE